MQEEKEIIAAQGEKLKTAVAEINEEVSRIYQAVNELAAGNSNTAQECTDISTRVLAITEFCAALNTYMQDIIVLIGELAKNNEDVVSIASQTNPKSLVTMSPKLTAALRIWLLSLKKLPLPQMSLCRLWMM